MPEQTEELKCPTIKTLDDYMAVITEICRGNSRTGINIFLLNTFIMDFEENNPGTFQKFKFEHSLRYDKELLTSEDLTIFFRSFSHRIEK